MAGLADLGSGAARATEDAGAAFRAGMRTGAQIEKDGQTIMRFVMKDGSSFDVPIQRGFAGAADNGLMTTLGDYLKAHPDELQSLSAISRDGEALHLNPTSEIRGADGKPLLGAGPESGNWLARTRTFLGKNYKPIIGGIALTSLIAAAGIYLGCTDKRQVTITNLKVVPGSSNLQIQVDYNDPGASVGCIAGTFRPRINDTFTFSGTQTTPRLETFGACSIIKIISKTSVVVRVSSEVTDIGTGTGGWGVATCSSLFENQLGGLFASMVATVATVVVQSAAAAGGAAAEGLCAALPALCDALGGVGGGLASLPMLILGFCCLISLCVAMFILISKFS